MADPLVRRDIWALEEEQPWHPITEAYARAIGEMQRRHPDDPTSWSYQAAVHGVPFGVTPDEWRDQCQHNSWFFLPWHRMYLYWFERIVREAVRSLGDPYDGIGDTWALPYWNYDRGAPTATLPAAFREPTLPDGSTRNPLFVLERDPAINAGAPLPALATSPARALAEPFFSPPVTAGFGGPVTDWHHFDEIAAIPGALERTPHNVVHGLVGGDGGFMSGFDTAPLDPVFWLHHANVDRLWSVWLAQDGRSNPSEDRWTGFSFDFHDEFGVPVRNRPADVLDAAGQLGYTYDEVAAPRVIPRATMPSQPPPDHPPELVGASDERIELTGRAATVAVPVSAPSGPLTARGAGGAPERVYLQVEGIEGERNPGLSYAVYVNLPGDDDSDSARERHYVGNVAFFGIERAADLDRDHPGGHGLRYAFDITELAADLGREGRWDAERVTVSFEPLAMPAPADTGREAAAPAPPVRIGRVGIYVQ